MSIRIARTFYILLLAKLFPYNHAHMEELSSRHLTFHLYQQCKERKSYYSTLHAKKQNNTKDYSFMYPLLIEKMCYIMVSPLSTRAPTRTNESLFFYPEQKRKDLAHYPT